MNEELTITLSESKRFVELERVIEHGKQTFVEVGSALAEIRDEKLYRADYKTFDQYCREKWGLSRIHVHRVIEASKTVKMLPIGNKLETESQARELSKAPVESRPAILEKVSAAGPVTAKAIQREVEAEKWGPGGAPIKPAEHAPEDDESDALFGLKRYWKKATKKERQDFLVWANIKTKTKKGKAK